MNNLRDLITSHTAERFLQMVTAGFYDRSWLALWLLETIGREYDDMDRWTEELRLEAFPSTCTWSIAIWEFVYGIEPDDSLPLEYRRQRILLRRQVRAPINPARIAYRLSMVTGLPVVVTEFVAPYTFRVEIDESSIWSGTGGFFDFQIALRLLKQIKPSHLSFIVLSVVNLEWDTTDYHAGATVERISEHFVEGGGFIVTDGEDDHTGVVVEQFKEVFVE